MSQEDPRTEQEIADDQELAHIAVYLARLAGVLPLPEIDR